MTLRQPPSPASTPPRPEQFYRHKYGGIYQFLEIRLDEHTGPQAVHLHVWPFEQRRLERPLPEFLDRFTSMSAQEVQAVLQGDRQSAQAEVAHAKATAQG